MDALWPDDDASEANLVQHVFLMRQLFAAHSPDQTFVVTHHAQGYRFVAPVRTIAADSRRGAGWREYARGRFYADQRTQASLKIALQAFEEARIADPANAAPFSGIASCHALRAEYLFAPSSTLESARAAAMQALAIDPSDVEGHLALGDVSLFRDWNLAQALAAYERALWLDSSNSRARILRAWLFGISGDYDRGVLEVETALAREPYSLELLTMLGVLELMRGEFSASLKHCEGVLQLDPGYRLARYYRRAALAYGDHPDAAFAEFDEDGEDGEYLQQSLAIGGYAAGRCNHIEKAERTLETLSGGKSFAYVSAVNVAHVLLGLGRPAEAVHELARGVDERDAWSVFIPEHPLFRDLPGMQDVARRVFPTPAPQTRR
jgi:tetratricopeptide (TPR) repeat protein